MEDGIIPLDDCFFIPHKIYIITQAVVVYYIPILVMVFFYIRIVYALYKNNKQLQKMLSTKDNDHKQKKGNKQIGNINLAYREGHETISSSNVNLSNTSETREERQPGKSTKNAHQISDTQLAAQNKQNAKHKRITQTLGIIILAYLICWLPFCLSWPIHAFCECINIRFYDFTYWAAYINSTLNPILYFVINRDFREALRRVALKMFTKTFENEFDTSTSSVTKL